MAKAKRAQSDQFTMSIPNNMDLKVRDQKWIGLAEVVPDRRCDILEQGYAAFVPVVAGAYSVRAFYSLVHEELKSLHLKLVRIEDMERLSVRRRRHRLPKDLEAEIASLGPARRLALGTFHAFKQQK
jgi:hypothetical protein